MTLNLATYEIEQTSATPGSVGVVGSKLLTGLLLAAAYPVPHPEAPGITHRSYEILQNNGTYSQLQNMFTGAYHSYLVDFEEIISDFYADLYAKQEPLGKEFEKVLYDNLWDLYVDY